MNTSVSIYEFFKKFETWSRGILSQSAQAHALYTKHLDRSLVQGSKELEERRESYIAMRDWLILKWGRATLVGDLYLTNISNLHKPHKTEGSEAAANYLKSIYSNLVTVSTLEITKGRPVAGLEDYISSNRWLKEVYIALPRSLQKRVKYRLEDEDVELDEIEGKYYLQIIISMVKSAYKSLEADMRLPQESPKSAAPAPTPAPQKAANLPKKPQKTSAHAAQVQQTNLQQNSPAAQMQFTSPPPPIAASQSTGQQRPNQSGSNTNSILPIGFRAS